MVHEPPPKHRHLKRRILIPLALGLSLITLAAVTVAYKLQQRHFDRDLRVHIEGVRQSFDVFKNGQTAAMTAQLDLLKENGLLKKDWLAKDRSALLEHVLPFFENMRKVFGITHLYFINPDKSCFLRVHKPRMHDDVIRHFTLAMAAKNGKPARGLELGRRGTLTLRVVIPWVIGDRPAGYLEIGKEAASFARQFRHTVNGDILFVIKKSLLDRASWEKSMKEMGRPAEWERYTHAVPAYSTVKKIPAGLSRIINLPHSEHAGALKSIDMKGKRQRVGFTPLHDAAGREIGGIFVTEDVSSEASSLRALSVYMILILAVVGGALCLFFFFYVRDIERKLRRKRNDLLDEINAHKQTASELEEYKDNLEAIVSEQTEALRATNRELQRKMAEAEEAEERTKKAYSELDQIFEASSAMEVLDAELRVIRVNNAFAHLVGIEKDEALGRNFSDVLSCTDEDSPECCARQVIERGECMEREALVRRPDGSSILVFLTAAPYRDADGGLNGVVFNFQDITARKQAELAAVKAEGNWERTFDAMGDIVTIHDPEMHIVRANKAASEALDLPLNELVGKFCYEVFRGAENACPGCPELGTKHDYTVHSAEIYHPNLGKTFLVSASPILDDDGRCTGIIHVAKDITEHKKLKDQLLHAQKMEAVGTLAGGVAHDFNNILTGIIGFAELGLVEDSQQHRDLKEILGLAKRGANLTRQLLAFGRRQALEMRVLDLNELVKDLSKLINRLIGENIDYEFIAGRNLGSVKADPGQIEQVVMNLVVNARDAMPGGGKITVKTANAALDVNNAPKHIDVIYGPYVQLKVSDTGRGMEKTMLEHIFEPFFTTKERGKGTGLGLSTAYGIIKQHNGYIFVDSEPGRGTTFDIYLPRVDEKGRDRTRAEKQEHAGLRGTETVLLAEDDDSVRNVALRILEELGYSVLAAGDPEAAETLFDEHAEDIALLLTDVVMPKRSGTELYERLSRKRPSLKVIYMSGYTDINIARKTASAPDAPFIQKPFTKNKLGIIVREVLDRRSS